MTRQRTTSTWCSSCWRKARFSAYPRTSPCRRRRRAPTSGKWCKASSTCTTSASSTATSSRPTCCWARTAACSSPTSACATSSTAATRRSAPRRALRPSRPPRRSRAGSSAARHASAPLTSTSTCVKPSRENISSGYSPRAADIWSMGITLYAFVHGYPPFYDDNVLTLYRKIQNEPVKFAESSTISDDLKDLIVRMLQKDPTQRITLPEIKMHPWVTCRGAAPLPSLEENCELVEVTDEEVMQVVQSIPKLDTLILIKTMLKKHSFQNPFSQRRRCLASAATPLGRDQTDKRRTDKFQRCGRSHSAPGSYDLLDGLVSSPHVSSRGDAGLELSRGTITVPPSTNPVVHENLCGRISSVS
ncbi:MAP kinase-activated protein kinase 2 isoform X4 [Bacillus rossius redtenbacheri]|uniref:MAP kinase-activated protein kinase 2 isoform X4 n=1 Tax=Bacillus rossius redtenbacheri TaxID=93214 RepID=UPI002FDD1A01